MTGLFHDLRYAQRQLRKGPTFALFTICIMAMGIGSTVATFSVVDAVLLQPLRYRQPGPNRWRSPASLLASYLPARRAARIEPMEALRYE